MTAVWWHKVLYDGIFKDAGTADSKISRYSYDRTRKFGCAIDNFG